jgi:hypothetical protein
MRWKEHVARMGETRSEHNNLFGKSEGKIPFGIPTRKGQNSIKTDIKLILCKDVNWIHLARDRDHWQLLATFFLLLFCV